MKLSLNRRVMVIPGLIPISLTYILERVLHRPPSRSNPLVCMNNNCMK